MTASDDFWQRVLATARDLEAYNYYQLFGIERAASTDDVTEAFYRFARAIHPDKHAFEPDPDRQRALVQVYARLHEGYRVLGDAQHRQEYDAKLAEGETRHAAAAAQIEEKVLHKVDPATEQGRQALERGVAYFEEGDLPRARAQLQLAKQLEPSSKVIDKAFAEVMKTDRRRYPRYDLDQRVEVQCAGWEQPAVVYIKDISRSGLFLKSNAPPKEGTVFELKLCLPRSSPVFVSAKVAHRIGSRNRKRAVPGFGLEFLNLSDEQWSTIEHILPHAKEAARHQRVSSPPPMSAPPPATRPLVATSTTESEATARPAPAPASRAAPMATQTGKQAVQQKPQDDKGHSRVSVKIPKALLAQSGKRSSAPRKVRLQSTASGTFQSSPRVPSVRGTTPGTGPAAPRPAGTAPAADNPGANPPAAAGPGSNPPAAAGPGSNPPAAAGPGSNPPAAAGPGSNPPVAAGAGSNPPAHSEFLEDSNPAAAMPGEPAITFRSQPRPAPRAAPPSRPSVPSTAPSSRPPPAAATPTAPRIPTPSPNPASSEDPLSVDYLFGDDD